MNYLDELRRREGMLQEGGENLHARQKQNPQNPQNLKTGQKQNPQNPPNTIKTGFEGFEGSQSGVREEISDVQSIAANPPKTGGGDAASWGWWIEFADRDPVSSYYSPEATRQQVQEDYPDAVAIMPYAPPSPPTSAALTGEEETRIRAWLDHIEEKDPAIIAGVLSQCQRDPDARRYFLEQ
jgi:hypothetical protein